MAGLLAPQECSFTLVGTQGGTLLLLCLDTVVSPGESQHECEMRLGSLIFRGVAEVLSGVASVPLASLKGLARAAPRGPEAVLTKAVGEVAALTPAYTNGKSRRSFDSTKYPSVKVADPS